MHKTCPLAICKAGDGCPLLSLGQVILSTSERSSVSGMGWLCNDGCLVWLLWQSRMNGGTNIALSIKQAGQLLRGEDRDTARILVLLTDGRVDSFQGKPIEGCATLSCHFGCCRVAQWWPALHRKLQILRCFTTLCDNVFVRLLMPALASRITFVGRMDHCMLGTAW